MVKVMDFKSEGGSACRFDSWPGRFFFSSFFMMMMVERRAAAQASVKRERRRAGMSAANVGASFLYVATWGNTKPGLHCACYLLAKARKA